MKLDSAAQVLNSFNGVKHSTVQKLIWEYDIQLAIAKIPNIFQTYTEIAKKLHLRCLVVS